MMIQLQNFSLTSVLSEFLYFGQKDLSTRSESFDESFLDRLLADRLDAQPQEEERLLEQVQQSVKISKTQSMRQNRLQLLARKGMNSKFSYKYLSKNA